jgi:hypothetical protein
MAALVWTTDVSATPFPLAHRAAGGADNAVGHAGAQAQRVADRQRALADVQLRRVGEPRGLEAGVGGADDGEVVGGEGTTQRRAVPRPVLRRDGERPGSGNDVRGRDDVSIAVEHDSGPELARALDLHDRRQRHLHGVLGGGAPWGVQAAARKA